MTAPVAQPSRTVWFVNHHAGAPQLPAAARHYHLADRLSEFGWSSKIIASASNIDLAPTEYDKRAAAAEANLIWVPGPGYAGNGPRRLLSWMAFAGRVATRVDTKGLPPPDVVVGSTVHLPAAWAGLRLARHYDVPYVFEVRDLWPATPIEMGALKSDGAMARALLALEGHLAKSADLIVSPLKGAGRYYLDIHGVPLSRFLWISNGVDLRDYPEPVDGYSGPNLRLQYFGSMGSANAVDQLIRAVSMANVESGGRVEMRLFGDGPLRNHLTQMVDHLDLRGQVTFHERVPHSEVGREMKWGNALGMVVADHSGLYRYGIAMNKLFDYLASGQWIVIGADVPENPLANAPGAVVARPTAEDMACAMLETIAMDPDVRRKLGLQNREVARNEYDFSILAKRLATALDEICD